MLRAVQFNNQFCLSTIKICNIFTKHLLPGKTDGIISQKVIPQMALLACHIFTQGSGDRHDPFIMFSIHSEFPFARKSYKIFIFKISPFNSNDLIIAKRGGISNGIPLEYKNTLVKFSSHSVDRCRLTSCRGEGSDDLYFAGLPLEGDSPVRGNVRGADKRVPPAEQVLSNEVRLMRWKASGLQELGLNRRNHLIHRKRSPFPSRGRLKWPVQINNGFPLRENFYCQVYFFDNLGYNNIKKTNNS